MNDTIIIGGGIAGLTAAWSLHQAGRKVVVLDAGSEAGGNIRTITRKGFSMERGPNSFMGSSEAVWQLLDELGLTETAEAASSVSNNRYIYRNGRLHAMPLGVTSFLTTKLLSWKSKFRLAMEPFIKGGAQPHDTAWDFFSRRFGKEATTYIMSPFISGVYAGDISALGARAAFPKFWQFEKDSGSMILGARKYMIDKKARLKAAGIPYRKGLFSMPGGLGGLTSALTQRLGQRVIVDTTVRTVAKKPDGWDVYSGNQMWSAKQIVLAAPPHNAADILSDPIPEAAAELRRIPLAPITVVHWSGKDPEQKVPRGFGYLIPRVTGVRMLGTLFPSQLFSRRAPEDDNLFTSFYGGALDEEAMGLDDNELLGLLLQEQTNIIGGKMVDARARSILRYQHAIPQLLPRHPETIAALQKAVTSASGLVLAGNYLAGVGIEQAVQSGYDAARELLEKDGGK
jgi:protoporphyrinogen/coproporphyrinogen III oxidase